MRSEELLLNAALRPGPEAERAWARWRASVSLDNAPGGLLRAAPLAYRNLAGRPGFDDADLDRIRGLYRKTWAKNQLLRAAAAELLGLLESAGVEAILFGGTALSTLNYEDPGVRPIGAVDLLVRPADAGRAETMLAPAGWNGGGAEIERAIRRRDALRLEDAVGLDLNLHWYSSPLSADDSSCWEHAVAVEIDGQRCLALSATDQLLERLVHGAYRSEGSMLWVADAARVIAAGQVDWGRLAAEARGRRLTVVVARGLRYLLRSGWAEVPGELVAELEADARCASGWERAGAAALHARPSPLRTLRIARDRRTRMRQTLPHEQVPGPVAAIDGLFRYRRRGELIGDALRSLGRAARRRLTPGT